MADSVMETQPSEAASQQVTSQIPTTAPAKNPKRVAAGKAVAEKTRQARAVQKKAVAEAAVIIENSKADRRAQASPDTSSPDHPMTGTTGQHSKTSKIEKK